MIDAALRTEGKTEPWELWYLYYLAMIAPDGPAVEVGALYGRSVLAWSVERRGRGRMLVVDDNCHYRLIQNLPPDVGRKKGISWQVAPRLPDLAFCFVDGDHSDRVFPKDLAAYTDRIMPSGIIAFHDYDAQRPEFAVKPAVDKWRAGAGWEYLGQVGSVIAFRRPA